MPYQYIKSNDGEDSGDDSSAFELNNMPDTSDVAGTMRLLERTLVDLSNIFVGSSTEKLREATQGLFPEEVEKMLLVRRDRIEINCNKLTACCDMLSVCLEDEICSRKESKEDHEKSFSLSEEFRYRYTDELQSLRDIIATISTLMSGRIDRTYRQLTGKATPEMERIYSKNTSLDTTEKLTRTLNEYKENAHIIISKIYMSRTGNLDNIVTEYYQKREQANTDGEV